MSIWWRRRESNPRPNMFQRKLLRAQTVILGVKHPFPAEEGKPSRPSSLVASYYMARAKLIARTFTTQSRPTPSSWSFRGGRSRFIKQRQQVYYRCSFIYKRCPFLEGQAPSPAIFTPTYPSKPVRPHESVCFQTLLVLGL